jgi:hypothetical protein
VSPLDYADGCQHIVLSAPKLLAILVGAGVDGVAAFVVELHVVVGRGLVVTPWDFGLRRLKLDVFCRLRGGLCGLKGRPSLAGVLDIYWSIALAGSIRMRSCPDRLVGP